MNIERLSTLWIEKYRPQTLNDLCLDESIRELIVKWGNDNKIPHLLLVGGVGIGKTSTARIIALDILKCDYLYINASDENGVETMRNKVTGFVQTKSLDGNIKLVILDEADAITFEGQNILRNMMESYADNARFILTGNYRHKISLALQSRCRKIDLKFSKKDVLKRLVDILLKENIDVTTETIPVVSNIVKSNYPDVRSCIDELNLRFGDGFEPSQAVNTCDLVKQIWENTQDKLSLVTRKYLIENESLFLSDWDRLLKDLLNYVYDLDQLNDIKKKMVILTIADHLEKSTRVIDKEINLFACLLNIENL